MSYWPLLLLIPIMANVAISEFLGSGVIKGILLALTVGLAYALGVLCGR